MRPMSPKMSSTPPLYIVILATATVVLGCFIVERKYSTDDTLVFFNDLLYIKRAIFSPKSH